MKKGFRVGDLVGWYSEAGHVRETIKEKINSVITFKGHIVRALSEEPQYLIKSDRTGIWPRTRKRGAHETQKHKL